MYLYMHIYITMYAYACIGMILMVTLDYFDSVTMYVPFMIHIVITYHCY